ncbi:hypothetical protein KIPE111705_12970 [Kibdelosporangium persicum]
MLTGLAVTPASAHTYSIVDGHAVDVRTGPGMQEGTIGAVSGGQRVAVACTVRGESVTGPNRTTDVWDYIHLKGYIPDAYVHTGVSTAVGPPCGGSELHWDPSEMNLRAEQPGTRRLYDEIKANPAWNLRGGDAHFAGIYADRRGEHGEGRALDYWMDVDVPAEFTAGWELADYLRANAGPYGIQTIIWNDKAWLAGNPDAGWQEYDEIANCGASTKTCKHNDHVHIGQNWAGAVLKTAHWGH